MSRKITNKLKSSAGTRAYLAGQAAYKRGTAMRDNPFCYPPTIIPKLARIWASGWGSAMDFDSLANQAIALSRKTGEELYDMEHEDDLNFVDLC